MRIFITLIIILISTFTNANTHPDSVDVNSLTLEERHKLCDEYLEKATSLYKKRNYHEALTNYILAEKYIDSGNDLYLKTFINHGMALTHFQLNNFDDSEKLLLENYTYFNDYTKKDTKDVGHQLGLLNTLSRLSYLYVLTGEVNKAIDFNDLDFRKTENFKDELNYFYALKNKGIIQYKLKKYKESIRLLNEAIPGIQQNEDYYWVMVCYFYIARDYKELGDLNNAIKYYEKVDALFKSTNIIDNVVRENFTELIQLYEKTANTEKQLEKVNSLLKFDSINYATNNEISNKYYKEYAYKDLVNSKKELESKLSSHKSKSGITLVVVIVVFALICVIGVIFYLKRVKQIKKQFDAIIEEHINKNTQLKVEKTVIDLPQSSIGNEEDLSNTSFVDEKTKRDILNRLAILENDLFFLDHSTSLSSLAGKLETNTKYLSNIINEEKGGNFKKYINDLRIAYIINMSIEDVTYQRYSIEGLADLCGFKSRQTFSDHFLEYAQMRPSVFLKNIESFDRDQLFK